MDKSYQRLNESHLSLIIIIKCTVILFKENLKITGSLIFIAATCAHTLLQSTICTHAVTNNLLSLLRHKSQNA